MQSLANHLRLTGRARGGRKGRGKGGKKLGVRGGLINKDNLVNVGPRSRTAEVARQSRKQDWKEWLEKFKSETQAKVDKCRRDNITCPECREKISLVTFYNHRTKGGCTKAEPRLKMSNWSLDEYL